MSGQQQDFLNSLMKTTESKEVEVNTERRKNVTGEPLKRDRMIQMLIANNGKCEPDDIEVFTTMLDTTRDGLRHLAEDAEVLGMVARTYSEDGPRVWTGIRLVSTTPMKEAPTRSASSSSTEISRVRAARRPKGVGHKYYLGEPLDPTSPKYSMQLAIRQRLHQRSRLLFEAFEDRKDYKNETVISMYDAIGFVGASQHFTDDRGQFSRYHVQESFGYLLAIGSIQRRGRQVKIILQHPDDCRPEFADLPRLDTIRPNRAEAERAGEVEARVVSLDRLPRPETVLDATLAKVTDGDLAHAMAHQLFDRFAEAELQIAKLRAEISAKDAEIEQLRELLSYVPKTHLTDLAQRMIDSDIS